MFSNSLFRFPTQSLPDPNRYLWITAMLTLFIIIYTPIDYLLPQLAHLPLFLTRLLASQGIDTPTKMTQEVIIPLKGLLFWASLFILGQPIYLACRDYLLIPSIPWRKIALQAWFTFIGTALLAFPQHLTSLGWIYGRMSLSPFTEPYGWYYKRLFMPAVAHGFMFRGLLFYFIFTLLLTYLLIYLCILWLYIHQVKLSLWQLISLSSSTFIIYQFQAPGYPDVLIFSFMLLAAIVPLSNWGQLSLVVFCLAAHEGSLIPLTVLILFACKWAIFWRTLVIYIIYISLWFSNQSFNVTTALVSQDVDTIPAWQWLLTYPSHEILGIFFAYKALWFIIIVSIILLIHQKNYLMAGQISSLIGASLLMTFLAVDTTRLVGFSFFALLLAVKVCYDHAYRFKRRLGWQRFLIVVWGVNLLLPSVYVGLNHPFTISTGLYYWLWLSLR